MNHTNKRIEKLAAMGLSEESIARKIGRPGDLERVRKVTSKLKPTVKSEDKPMSIEPEDKP